MESKPTHEELVHFKKSVLDIEIGINGNRTYNMIGSKKYAWRFVQTEVSEAVDQKRGFSRVLNSFGKSSKKSLKRMSCLSLFSMPLYINDSTPEIKMFSRWRLQIGK